MQVDERISLRAPPEKVWDFLWDIERLARCVPGCREVRTLETGRQYAATFEDAVGPYRIHFDSDVRVMKVDPQTAVALAVNGRDDRLGATMKLDLAVSLDGTESTGTIMWIEGDLQILGKLATLGQPVVRRKMKKLTEAFVHNIRFEIEPKLVPETIPLARRMSVWLTRHLRLLERSLRHLVRRRSHLKKTSQRTPSADVTLDRDAPTTAPQLSSAGEPPTIPVTRGFQPFRVVQPRDAREASAELRRLGEGAWPYAGGAELLLLMRQGLVKPDVLVDLKSIPGMKQLSSDEGTVTIGGALTHDEVARSEVIRSRLPALATAAAELGNIRVRHQGTLGGNLCFADPHSDPPTALLLYETTAVVQGPDRRREIALSEFILDPYDTALLRDEILTHILVTPLSDGWTTSFLRVERLFRPTVNVAVGIKVESEEVSEARLVVGCIGPRAERLNALESEIRGVTTDEAVRAVAEAHQLLAEALDPVGDLLGSADYKTHLATVLLSRAIDQAIVEYGSESRPD